MILKAIGNLTPVKVIKRSKKGKIYQQTVYRRSGEKKKSQKCDIESIVSVSDGKLNLDIKNVDMGKIKQSVDMIIKEEGYFAPKTYRLHPLSVVFAMSSGKKPDWEHNIFRTKIGKKLHGLANYDIYPKTDRFLKKITSKLVKEGKLVKVNHEVAGIASGEGYDALYKNYSYYTTPEKAKMAEKQLKNIKNI